MTKQFRNIIFDLDGTLTNPTVGILNSTRYALQHLGFTELPKVLPLEFIGPPLQKSFSEIYGLNGQDTAKAVRLFREYYGQKGLYENIPFPGISDLLSTLNEMGKSLFVATSKLEKFSWQIIRHFEFDKYIKDLSGADYDGNHTKSVLIKQLIEKYQLENSETVMIGDTEFDLVGAAESGVSGIGVSYGFGSESDLQRFNPIFIADSPMELLEYLA
jgi:phosphoglycolate phosphatase